MAFLRNLLASILGTLLALGILFFMLLIFVSLAGSADQVQVKSESVLELDIPYPVSEFSGYDSEDPFSVLFDPTLGLNEIVKAIALAKSDDRIKGISLNRSFVMAGISQTRAIRNALLDFKASGKFVYAYADVYTQKDYYLATAADSVFLNPVGSLDFKGLAAEVLYFGDFQDKSGIRMEVVRHGKYKSAVEPFLGNDMSPENRSQLKSLLQGVWTSIRDEIALSRTLTSEFLDTVAGNLEGRLPNLALENGLIDGVLYQDEFEQKLAMATGRAGSKPNTVSLTDYLKYTKNKRRFKGSDRIAVIYAEGEIIYGQGGSDFIDPETMRESLRQVREDKKVKAVVLRINSPGGSALSSELIWREIQEVRKVKPVVVSFSDVAASGGYYIGVASEMIFTEPTTITGSIGVFATIPNVNGLADKFGINAEQVGTHRQSVDYSLFEPLNDDFREVLRSDIEITYNLFLTRVAEGRDISVSRADSLAQGRVWSGTDAVALGLADALGGLDDALSAAADLAGIDSYRILSLPQYKNGLEQLMDELGATATHSGNRAIEQVIGEDGILLLKEMQRQAQQQGVQARLPFQLKIN
jgi:protease-4